MSKENLKKKVTELRNFLVADSHRAQEFIMYRDTEKKAVQNLEKIFLSHFGINGKATVQAVACMYLLEEIEKLEKDKSYE